MLFILQDLFDRVEGIGGASRIGELKKILLIRILGQLIQPNDDESVTFFRSRLSMDSGVD